MLYVFDHDPNGHIGFYWGVANDGSVVVLNHLHHFQLVCKCGLSLSLLDLIL